MRQWFADYSTGAPLDEKEKAFRAVALAKGIGLHLERHYPRHRFHVKVDLDGGIARFSHPLLPVGYGYTLHLSELFADPHWKCVTRAGGELLERFYLPAGPRRQDLWEEASKRYNRIKRGILRETDWSTGKKRFVLPQELAR